MIAHTSTLTREQLLKDVIAIAIHLPIEKLTSWYQYGLFIQSSNTTLIPIDNNHSQDVTLENEFIMWDKASDEDWLMIEKMLKEPT